MLRLAQLSRQDLEILGYFLSYFLAKSSRASEAEESSTAASTRFRSAMSSFKSLYTWLQSIFKPAGKLKKAIPHSLNQHEYLCTFLDYGEIEISNNQVKNAIRPIVVGRKNWLFSDTQDGTDASMKVFSLVETAKANGLDPQKYIGFLLESRPNEEMTEEELEQLAPGSTKVKAACMK